MILQFAVLLKESCPTLTCTGKSESLNIVVFSSADDLTIVSTP